MGPTVGARDRLEAGELGGVDQPGETGRGDRQDTQPAIRDELVDPDPRDAEPFGHLADREVGFRFVRYVGFHANILSRGQGRVKS